MNSNVRWCWSAGLDNRTPRASGISHVFIWSCERIELFISEGEIKEKTAGSTHLFYISYWLGGGGAGGDKKIKTGNASFFAIVRFMKIQMSMFDR